MAEAGEGDAVPEVGALFFDVFGTLVDWRGSIARDAPPIIGREIDGFAFADAWRDEYQPGMEGVRKGDRGYVKLDLLHRENLERILPRFGLTDLAEDARVQLNLLWHRLDAWPDVEFGLSRLRRKFRLAPVSNGNIGLMVDLARKNGFVWDAILGAEIARDYKPKPAVYLAAAEALGLPPERCMMVAAHSYDLAAAAECGLRTAHIARPDEHGPGTGETQPLVPVDVAAGSLTELAQRLST
ncbi:haloacid dehalogenase type II [Enterovirga rhinocerotis]|uniref:(S)-2-haloacid dehalogenase n=1 Tax=Enterovirga rhinocerotis TaxID=1339210 RepID=A0A4R7BZN1_9HYPH|nr:haloacid dehalogenase type II [Enterovirga rhinocerotis]TDR89566.1 2-haloacid dehalogenase [Enterovirga rhinocerotis]